MPIVRKAESEDRINQVRSKIFYETILNASTSSADQDIAAINFQREIDAGIELGSQEVKSFPPITAFEAQLLGSISLRKQRRHRVRLRSGFELGAVLAPVGRTIFDNSRSIALLYRKNITEKENDNKGVRESLSHKMEESDANSLKVVFEGALTREVIAETLKGIMAEQRLSIRAAAARVGVSKNVIDKVKSCDATIDQGLRVLGGLGCEHQVRLSVTPSEDPGLG